MSSALSEPNKANVSEAVAVGWDNPLMTYFAQVILGQVDEDTEDAIVLWLGGLPREVLAPEAMVEPLAPWLDLSAPIIDQLKLDRLADVDRGPSPVQREAVALIDGIGRARRWKRSRA